MFRCQTQNFFRSFEDVKMSLWACWAWSQITLDKSLIWLQCTMDWNRSFLEVSSSEEIPSQWLKCHLQSTFGAKAQWKFVTGRAKSHWDKLVKKQTNGILFRLIFLLTRDISVQWGLSYPKILISIKRV